MNENKEQADHNYNSLFTQNYQSISQESAFRINLQSTLSNRPQQCEINKNLSNNQ